MAETIVFWDFSGCPVPEGLPVNNVVSNIVTLLRCVMSWGISISHSLCDTQGTKEERLKKVFVDFMGKAIIGHRQPLNLVLIMEDISEHPEILHALEFCKGRKNINILLSPATS
ncbi:unnamed protein product [Brassica rapa subsp. narinosa]